MKLINRTASVLALLLAATAVAQQMTPANEQLLPASTPVLRDPDARSGWIRVEMAVLVDNSPPTLAVETWPVAPQVRYPAQWRWLDSIEARAEIHEQFPGATVDVSARNAITVTLPPPTPPASATPDSEAIITGDPTIDPLTGLATATPIAEGVPLESLGTSPADQRDIAEAPVDDWLDPGASLADAAASLQSNQEPGDGPESVQETPASPEPPAEPRPFTLRPTKLLEEGLRALQRSDGRSPVISAGWVQPPGAKNLPIILDRSGDDGPWPALQGFVELRRGSELRVGINLWLNTAGEYLPADFAMDPPPRAPQRMRVIEPVPSAIIGTELEAGADLSVTRDLAASPLATSNSSTSESGSVTYIDPATGFEITTSAGAVDMGAVSTPTWPYRHLIHIADTRAVPERGVRYFDHPVIQTLVTWQELTWAEVWAMGETDREQFEALPTSGDGPPLPAAMLPPDQRGLR